MNSNLVEKKKERKEKRKKKKKQTVGKHTINLSVRIELQKW